MFRSVPAGSYSLMATGTGFLDGYLGQQSAADLPQNLVVGTNEIDHLRIQLWRPGTIAGRVLDQNGEPAVRVLVEALRLAANGSTKYVLGSSSLTDDRGDYRIVGLAAGSYVVAIPGRTFAGSSETGHPVVFFPHEPTSATASLLSLDAGERRERIDLRLDEVSTRTVSGELVGDTRRPVTARVRLVPQLSQAPATELEVIESEVLESRFVFRNVPPGDYLAQFVDFPPRSAGTPHAVATSAVVFVPMSGIPRASLQPVYWARTEIHVRDADVAGVSMSLKTGFRISGRFIFDGNSTKPQPEEFATVPVVIRGAEGGGIREIPLAPLGPDGSFSTVQLPPGDYAISLSPGSFGLKWPGWRLKSIASSGRASTSGLVTLGEADLDSVVITLTDQPVKLSGVVHDATGQLRLDATIYAFPADPNSRADLPGWPMTRQMATRTSTDSFFHITGLLPGDYFVVAIIGPTRSDWSRPSVLAELERRAVSVRVSEHEVRQLDLRAYTLPK